MIRLDVCMSRDFQFIYTSIYDTCHILYDSTYFFDKNYFLVPFGDYIEFI